MQTQPTGLMIVAVAWHKALMEIADAALQMME
jgi:hypothetical protein